MAQNLRNIIYSNYSLSEEVLGYVTSPDPTNTDTRYLVAGSKNVLINYQKKVQTRGGYTRLGPANAALTNVRNAFTWNTSTASALPQRFYNQTLEVYLRTIDGTAINAWTTVRSGWSSTAMLRAAFGYFDATERLDNQLMTNGDANTYMWSGAVAIVSSVSGQTTTVAGDTASSLTLFTITGATSSNTNGYKLYWKLTNSGSTRTINVYKDAAGSNLVASGSRTGDGSITLTQQNTSGISGSVTVAYTTDETTLSAQILTIGYSLTKTGTTTWNKNRFMQSLAGRSLVNARTGQIYTYSGGETTTTLTNVSPTTAVDFQAGDIIMQAVVVNTNSPAAGRINDIPFVFQNQLALGSYSDNEIYVSKNTDYTSFSFSTPRLSGEGALLNLDSPCRAINNISKTMVIFAGNSSLYKTTYTSITVGSTLSETLTIDKLDTGVNQGALNHECVVPIGNSLAYLTNEVALRLINSPDTVSGITPETYSNPIKPDFDTANWVNAFGTWYKNILFFTAPGDSHTFMLNFVEDSDGKLFRFWNPPQIFPIGAMSIIDSGNGPMLHGHSNVVPETYLLFDGLSDGQFTNMPVSAKIPIDFNASMGYQSNFFRYPYRAKLKNFDEFYVEGEISSSTTDLSLIINYNYQGSDQQVSRIIDGSDSDILEGAVGSGSLGQDPLGSSPLGGLLGNPPNANKFRVVFEFAREDYHEMQDIYSSNGIDQYWSIIARGPNSTVSTRRDTSIRK